MRKSILFLVAFFAVAFCFEVSAAKGPNQKFLKNAAKKIWAVQPTGFNPKAEIPDSLVGDAPAVNIAVYYHCKASRDKVDEIGNGYVAPITMMLGESDIEIIERRMVKILDAGALEDLTEFTFDADVDAPLQAGITGFLVENAFGARVHKPDGTIVYVDMKNTLTESVGKKGKEAIEHKIAIPGLEVGDVLEYFYLRHLYFLGNSGIDRRLEIFSEYPTASLMIETSLDSSLTTEFRTFNGVEPVGKMGLDLDKNEVYMWEFHNLPAFGKPQFCSVARQMPFIGMRVRDNISRLYKPILKSLRNPGVYMNLVTPVYLAETAEVIEGLKIQPEDMKKAMDILNNYRKNHPDADTNAVADAAWLAVLYVSKFSEENYNQFDITAFFKDVLDRIQLAAPSAVAISTSRDDVDIDQIMSYKEAYPLVLVGKRAYMLSENLALAPGELPVDYAGEKYYTMEGKRNSIFSKQNFFRAAFPKSNGGANSRIDTIAISVPDAEGNMLKVSLSSVRTGSNKEIGRTLVLFEDFYNSIGDYLEIPEKMRAKHKFDTAANAELKKKAMQGIAKSLLDDADVKVEKAEVTSLGNLPGKEKLSYNIDFTADGLITPAGDELILNIGAFAGGRQIKIKDELKPRKMSIFTDGPYLRKKTIIVEIPEGYRIDPADLNQLKCNVANLCGSFYVGASIVQETGNLKLEVNHRSKSAVFAPERWNDFIALRKAAEEYAGRTIVLHRK